MANNIEPDKTLFSVASHLVYPVCPGLSVRIFKVNLVSVNS